MWLHHAPPHWLPFHIWTKAVSVWAFATAPKICAVMISVDPNFIPINCTKYQSFQSNQSSSTVYRGERLFMWLLRIIIFILTGMSEFNFASLGVDISFNWKNVRPPIISSNFTTTLSSSTIRITYFAIIVAPSFDGLHDEKLGEMIFFFSFI